MGHKLIPSEKKLKLSCCEVMKLAIYVLFLLSAMKLEAQTDSVHIHLRGDSINVAGPTSILDRNYRNVGTGSGFDVLIPVNLNLALPIHQTGWSYADTPGIYSPVTLLFFQIDSTEVMLRNLTINVFPILTGPYAESNYQIRMDSAKIDPSHDVAVGSVWMRWVGSYNGNGPQPGYYEVGGVQDSGWQKDTMSLELRIAKSSGVSTDSRSPIALTIDNRVAYFSPESSNRYLHIFNLLGNSVCAISIPSHASEVQLPLCLLPGFYFAQLGGQVTRCLLTN